MAKRKLYNNVTQDAQGRYWSNTTDEDGNDIRVQVMPQETEDGLTYRAATEVEKLGPGANGLWNAADLKQLTDLGGTVPVGARFAAPANALALADIGAFGGGAGPDYMIGLQQWLDQRGKTLQDAIGMGGLPLRWNGDGTVTYDPSAKTQNWSYLNPDDGTFHKVAPLIAAVITGAGLAGVGAAGAGAGAGGAMDMGVGLGGSLGSWGGITPIAAGGGGATTIGGLGGLLGIESTGNAIADKVLSTVINQGASRAVNEVAPGAGALVGLVGGAGQIGDLVSKAGDSISSLFSGDGIDWSSDIFNPDAVSTFTGNSSEGWNVYDTLTNSTATTPPNVPGEINFSDFYNDVPTLPSGEVTPVNTNLTPGGMNTVDELVNSISSGGAQTVGSVGSGLGSIAQALGTGGAAAGIAGVAGGAAGAQTAASALSSILKDKLGIDVNPGTLDLIGKALGIGLGAYGANQQADASKDLFNTYLGMGAPYRAELANLNANPSSFYNSDIVKGAIQQSSDAMANSLSMRGNPANNPGALQEIQKNTTRGLLDAYNTRWNQLASAGQLGTSQAAGLGTVSNQASGNTYNALGAGLQSVFGNQRDYAGELIDLIKNRSGGAQYLLR